MYCSVIVVVLLLLKVHEVDEEKRSQERRLHLRWNHYDHDGDHHHDDDGDHLEDSPIWLCR